MYSIRTSGGELHEYLSGSSQNDVRRRRRSHRDSRQVDRSWSNALRSEGMGYRLAMRCCASKRTRQICRSNSGAIQRTARQPEGRKRIMVSEQEVVETCALDKDEEGAATASPPPVRRSVRGAKEQDPKLAPEQSQGSWQMWTCQQDTAATKAHGYESHSAVAAWNRRISSTVTAVDSHLRNEGLAGQVLDLETESQNVSKAPGITTRWRILRTETTLVERRPVENWVAIRYRNIDIWKLRLDGRARIRGLQLKTMKEARLPTRLIQRRSLQGISAGRTIESRL